MFDVEMEGSESGFSSIPSRNIGDNDVHIGLHHRDQMPQTIHYYTKSPWILAVQIIRCILRMLSQNQPPYL